MDTVSSVIPRDDWKANRPRILQVIKLPVPVSKLALTWTETETCTSKKQCAAVIKKLQKSQMDDENVPDIQYNFLIGGDGEVYEGCGWECAPKVSRGHRGYYRELNGKAILVAYIGPRDMYISEPMKLSLFSFKSRAIADKKLDKDVRLFMLPKEDPHIELSDTNED